MIHRSPTGQGRTSHAKVWIREKHSDSELESEARSRNNPLYEGPDEYSGDQSDLPKIWGRGWKPKEHLTFDKAIKPDYVIKEVLRFTLS